MSDKSISVYTFYTDSHTKLLYDYFLPSLSTTNSDLVLKIIKTEQHCASGNYMENGFARCTRDKIDHILSAIEETWGQVFVYADCDIQFFGSIKNDLILQLGDYDIAFQNDGWNNVRCTGFFISKSNENTKQLFKIVREKIRPNANDQDVLNRIVNHFTKNKLLDNKYYSFCHNSMLWNKDIIISPETISDDILTHHANCTIGVENKILLLEHIKQIMQTKRSKVES